MTKSTKWHVCPAKTQISLGFCPVWSVFADCMKKAWAISYPLSAQWLLWSDWADAQADLSLRWAHSHFVGFVMKWLISVLKLLELTVHILMCGTFNIRFYDFSPFCVILYFLFWQMLHCQSREEEWNISCLQIRDFSIKLIQQCLILFPRRAWKTDPYCGISVWTENSATQRLAEWCWTVIQSDAEESSGVKAFKVTHPNNH